jgi:hypothetical protein
VDGDGAVGPAHAAGECVQGVVGDVDRDVGVGVEVVEQDGGFGFVAGAVFDEGAAGLDAGSDVGGAGAQDAGFGAGGVVFGQCGDGAEQGAAGFIVEEFGRQGFAQGGEAAQGFGGDVAAGGNALDETFGHGRRSSISGWVLAGRSAVLISIRVQQSRSTILGETQAGELPAAVGVEEIAVGRAGVAGRGGERGAAQDHLVDHEFAVIFADRAGDRAKAGIG